MEARPTTLRPGGFSIDYAFDHAGIVSLLGGICDAGLDFMKTENLYTFDGERAYSLDQGSKAVMLGTLADEIVAARDARSTVVAPSDRAGAFSLEEGYAVGAEVAARYVGRGWTPAGLKVGFTNTTVWTELGLNEPLWAPMYRETITEDGKLVLAEYLAPRIEPEVALFLNHGRITGWAPAFEIVDAHFPDWRLTPADAVADAGLHARLVLGERRPLEGDEDPFGDSEVTLMLDGKTVERGHCSDVLGGPLAVWSWLREHYTPLSSLPLAGVHVVTTGSLTPVPYLKGPGCWEFTIDGYLGGSPVLEVL